MLVVNAARKEVDYAHLGARLPAGVTLDADGGPRADRAARPAGRGGAGRAWSRKRAQARLHEPRRPPRSTASPCHICRSGYTGEDGFEISVAGSRCRELGAAPCWPTEVVPIGLGARDTLRLEAGLCLYGHDIDETTSPVEAGLVWSIGKRRREEGGFPGAERIQRELANGPARLRVGLRLEGRAPAREGCEIVGADGERDRRASPAAHSRRASAAPIAMGYVAAAHAEPGTRRAVVIRGTPHPATVAPMPFVPHRYYRKTKSGRLTWLIPNTRAITNISASRTASARSASPNTPRTSSATSFSSSCRRSARCCPRARRPAVVESVKAASEVYAPVSRRSRRGQ